MAIELAQDEASDQMSLKTPGQLLYEKHVNAGVHIANCGSDSWADIGEEQQLIWQATALGEDLRNRQIDGQAHAWCAVADLLTDLVPQWARGHGNGLECALQAIKDLYAATQPQDRPMDTYELQYDLMQRSGQDLPTQVYITPQAVMYFALNMEELGETATAMAAAIHNADSADLARAGVTLKELTGFSQAADFLAANGAMMRNYARVVRTHVKEHFGQSLPRVPVSLEHAKEIADGCVDVAVVNAGMTLSLGLPGRRCYDDVVISNLSKTNPETGVIDKEPDGKWIKGPHYKQPNLGVIIEPLLWKPEQ